MAKSKSNNFTHDFGWALKMLKQGKRVQRLNWVFGTCITYQKGYPEGISCNKQTAEAWGISEGSEFKLKPYLQMRISNGSYLMWTPSVDDCLSNDWAVVE
ncbi:MAG: DUF2829 domain-containing protein [Bacilli bacterium]|nr:DUF2829 domain-containing protein [Bacilli bacterium]